MGGMVMGSEVSLVRFRQLMFQDAPTSIHWLYFVNWEAEANSRPAWHPVALFEEAASLPRFLYSTASSAGYRSGYHFDRGWFLGLLLRSFD